MSEDGSGTGEVTMKDLLREIASISANSKKADMQINAKLDSIQSSLQPIRDEVASHSQDIKYLKYERTRKNLVIFGLPQDGGESHDQLEEKILKLFVHTMGVTSFTLMELDFIRRAKTKSEKMPKPVILGLTTQRRKINILRNRGSLKETKIYIHEDMTIEEKLQEKALRSQMHQLRREGKFAIMRGGKLITENRKPQNQKIGSKRALSESPNVNETYHKRSNMNTSDMTDDSFENEESMSIDGNNPQVGEQHTVEIIQERTPPPLPIKQLAMHDNHNLICLSTPPLAPSNISRSLTQSSMDTYVLQNQANEQDQKK